MMEPGFAEQELSPFVELQKQLQRVSRIPYNNAAAAYHAAGISPDLRFGGSCLDKLGEMTANLPSEVEKMDIISSVVGKTTHYAMLVEIDGSEYYVDPFLWQSEPLELGGEIGEVKTLSDNWIIRKEKPEIDELLRIALVDRSKLSNGEGERVLITHKFDNKLDELPKPDTLGVKPELPSFYLQVPGLDGSKFYKVWFSKKAKQVADILVSDSTDGSRMKVTTDEQDSELRRKVEKEIEFVMGVSMAELVTYFSRAVDLEQEIGGDKAEGVQGEHLDL